MIDEQSGEEAAAAAAAPEFQGYEERARRFDDKSGDLRLKAWYYEDLAKDMRDHKALIDLRREFDGETRLTAEDSALGSQAPSLRDYRNKAKRTRDSLPARFYRSMTGEEWDGEAHSYSKARKKYRRWEEPYQQRERERQQRKKRDYSKKKRPADDNARRQARRIAQREESVRRQPWRQARPPTVKTAAAVAL